VPTSPVTSWACSSTSTMVCSTSSRTVWSTGLATQRQRAQRNGAGSARCTLWGLSCWRKELAPPSWHRRGKSPKMMADVGAAVA
jgi:hypothetical protein